MALWGRMIEPFRSHGFWGAIKSILGFSNPADAYQQYSGRFPGSNPQALDETFAAGLGAVQSGRMAQDPSQDPEIIRQIAPGIWEVPTGVLRYRFTVREWDSLLSAWKYHTYFEDTTDLLTPEEIEGMAREKHIRYLGINPQEVEQLEIQLHNVIITRSVG